MKKITEKMDQTLREKGAMACRPTLCTTQFIVIIIFIVLNITMI